MIFRVSIGFLFFSILVFSKDQAIYTIKGKKDPRLTAYYTASYISTSTSQECTNRHISTATRKPAIGRKEYNIKDVNYSIDIPVYLAEDEDNCGYKFSRIELVMRRLYDNNLYSLHAILSREATSMPIYFGDKGGRMGLSDTLMPGYLVTDKKHYRIAKNTTFFCKTQWFEKGDSSWFNCRMQIDNGKGGNIFQRGGKYNEPTHEKLGIDEIKSEVLYVNILVDDNCTAIINQGNSTKKVTYPFQELARTPTLKDDWETFKNIFKNLFN